MDTAAFVEVTSEDELRSLLGAPMPQALAKERDHLTEFDRAWLAHSPLAFVATADADGACDASPKGDPAGFTVVLDDRTIALPERPGNRRADGYRNILANPHVGLLFVLPGRPDTLRVNGRARIVRDAPFFDDMTVKGHRPRLALVVEIEQVFHHCPKAFLRSGAWKPETWNPEAVPSRARLVKALEAAERSLEELEEYYGDSYAERLYQQ
ncbi:hypothetical protein SRB5_33360 [Streptomyces sp. RB5]|uniref:Pyridoxamine 5'-phosphate oxidase N-terminal domain-containing protein n=1 Tax=Streptomyces smaragdinus TaxID=2585196 RepID=A0A7K0CIL9_9ACTN|nr:pyridoxamine 5'-phosphate oxidase family protein [Streptomyces smaragdinus]MQY13193.1 hypothetical protein [Streptomyces smaragdinus]